MHAWVSLLNLMAVYNIFWALLFARMSRTFLCIPLSELESEVELSELKKDLSVGSLFMSMYMSTVSWPSFIKLVSLIISRVRCSSANLDSFSVARVSSKNSEASARWTIQLKLMVAFLPQWKGKQSLKCPLRDSFRVYLRFSFDKFLSLFSRCSSERAFTFFWGSGTGYYL